MSTTVSYKGSTLTTISNETKKLDTAGTWLEDDITITDTASGGSVLVVDTPDSHGGTIREITAQNVVSLQGQKQVTPSATSQTIEPDTGYDGFESVVVSPGYSADEIAKKTEPSGAITLSVPYVSGYNASGIKDYAFYGNTAITSITITTYPNIYVDAFAKMTALTSFSAPICETLGNRGYNSASYVFDGCSALITVSIPKVTTLGAYAFRGCTSLQVIALPSLTGLGANGTFSGCSSLSTADLGNTTTLGNASCFSNCSSLSTIILRSTSVCTLTNTGNLDGTPFASGGIGGTIYIPETLYNALGTGTNDYKANTNWAVVDARGTITWAKIEGSYYETHYADGTLIPTS